MQALLVVVLMIISPVDWLTIPAVVTVWSWCKIIAVACCVRQIWPELLCVLNLLSNLLHLLVKTGFSGVVIFVSIRVPLTTSIGVSFSVVVVIVGVSSITRKVFISWEFKWLDFDFLVVPSVLLVYRISCSLSTLVRIILLIVDKKISVGVEEWIRSSLSSKLWLTTTHKNSFTYIVTRLLITNFHCHTAN